MSEVIGHKKSSRHEPCANRKPAVEEEHDDGQSRIAARSAVVLIAARNGKPAAQKRNTGKHEQRGSDKPRLVSGQARGNACAHAVRPSRLAARATAQPTQSIDEADRQQRQPEQQRLGHRRRLQVEDVGIEREQRHRDRRADSRAGDLQNDARWRSRPGRTTRRKSPRRTRRCDRRQSICTGSRFSRCGRGSQTAPICEYSGVRLSSTRRATTRCAFAS